MAIATKQQERNAIKKIRAIIGALDEGSYVGTALEGCLEIAESNIENDFADSMKSRWDSAKKEAEHFKSAANHFSDEAERAEIKINELRAQIEAMQAKIPNGDDLYDCIQLAKDSLCEIESKMQEAAAKIVEFADKPDSEEFRQVVAEHRSYKSDCVYYKSLISRLQACK